MNIYNGKNFQNFFKINDSTIKRIEQNNEIAKEIISLISDKNDFNLEYFKKLPLNKSKIENLANKLDLNKKKEKEISKILFTNKKDYFKSEKLLMNLEKFKKSSDYYDVYDLKLKKNNFKEEENDEKNLGDDYYEKSIGEG